MHMKEDNQKYFSFMEGKLHINSLIHEDKDL